VPLSRAPVERLTLRGDFRLLALSPDGATAYLYRYPRPGFPGRYEIRAMNTSSGRLSPRVLFDSGREGGLPVTGRAGSGGRRFYTLFAGDGVPYLQILGSAGGRVFTARLPQLRWLPSPFLLSLRQRGRHELVVRGRPPELDHTVPLLRIDTRTLAIHQLRALRAANRGARFLAFVKRPPRHPNAAVVSWVGVVGRSAGGRPIRLRQLGDRRFAGRVLVFGCIHGDECAAKGLEPVSVTSGCPDPEANIYLVPNLDPDGLAEGTRLNADGVDLNRNFSVDWRPIGRPGDPEYSGPRPFSEPESRLAARLVRFLQPRVTIWFHQHAGPRPFVRAWAQSAPAARRFARLADIPFRLMRWMDGTAPSWQNRRFPGTASYVVELPAGPLAPALEQRLERAIDLIGRREARVGEG
jgi:protein MpaA